MYVCVRGYLCVVCLHITLTTKGMFLTVLASKQQARTTTSFSGSPLRVNIF